MKENYFSEGGQRGPVNGKRFFGKILLIPTYV